MGIRRRHLASDADLAALADGSLAASRRIRVEQAVSESPDLQAAVAAQRHALSAIDQLSDEPAPTALRARLALAHHPPRRRARLRGVGLMAAAITVVVAAVLIGVITAGGGSAHPTVLQASRMAMRSPQASVAAPSGPSQTLPGLSAGGLNYPYLEDRFGYKAVGVRYDRFAGRSVTTVLYSRAARRLAYEIVSGPPLKLGRTSWSMTLHNVRFWVLDTPGATIVTWVRDGHSCVLVGRGLTVPVMLRLASWHEGGRVPY
jgi:anti-sigma factor RsiW